MPTGRGTARRPRAPARRRGRWGARLLAISACLLLLAPRTGLAAAPPAEPFPETLTDLPGEEPFDAPTPAGPPAPPPPAPEPLVEVPWLESSHQAVQRGLGAVVERFDRFFGEYRRLDLEAPSSRLRVKGWARASEVDLLESGASAAVSFKLPRLQAWLGNSRVVVSAENSGVPPSPQGASEPGVDPVPPGPPAETVPVAGEVPRSSGAAELRFDLVRHGVLVLDTGAGLRLTWPPIPYGKLRGHLVLPLGAGLVFRATETLIVEIGPRGIGSLTDLEVERLFWARVRLRLEGHGLINQLTRGEEWSTQLSAQWKVHPRTGLYAGAGAAGYGTPSPTLDVTRVFVGVRQDVWRDWLFLELEPEYLVSRPPGLPRQDLAAVTLRLEVLIDSRPAPVEETQ